MRAIKGVGSVIEKSSVVQLCLIREMQSQGQNTAFTVFGASYFLFIMATFSQFSFLRKKLTEFDLFTGSSLISSIFCNSAYLLKVADVPPYITSVNAEKLILRVRPLIPLRQPCLEMVSYVRIGWSAPARILILTWRSFLFEQLNFVAVMPYSRSCRHC